MTTTVTHQVGRSSIRPIREAIDQSEFPTTHEAARDLLQSLVLLTNMMEGTWACDIRLMDDGIERKALLCQITETRSVVAESLDLVSQTQARSASFTIAESAVLDDCHRRLIAVHEQINETLRWLETPHRTIDPSLIPEKGKGFKTIEAILADL